MKIENARWEVLAGNSKVKERQNNKTFFNI
jgi:hypothetical protein